MLFIGPPPEVTVSGTLPKTTEMTDVKPVQVTRKKVATLLGILLVFIAGGYSQVVGFLV